jgi:hypothetical protein
VTTAQLPGRYDDATWTCARATCPTRCDNLRSGNSVSAAVLDGLEAIAAPRHGSRRPLHESETINHRDVDPLIMDQRVSPTLRAGIRVVIMPDPASTTATTDATNTAIAHVDAVSERLILDWPYVSEEPLNIESGVLLLVLIAQPGDGLYSRPFLVESTQRQEATTRARAGWIVLRPTDLWQRIDRRRAERVVVSLPLTSGRRFPASGGSLAIQGLVRDLSESGLLVESDQRIGLGDTIEFELPLGDGQDPIHARVRVQRVQQATATESGGWLAGCRFEALRPPEQARILRFLGGQRHLGT